MMKYVEAELEKEGETLMGHLTTKDAYKNLEERINWFTQGAPPSETLYQILQVLYKQNGWPGSRCVHLH